MSRKKTGAGRPETFADRVSAEEGERYRSSRAGSRMLGVGEELLIGLAQRGHVQAVTRPMENGHTAWFFSDRTLDSLRDRLAGP